MTPPTKVDFSKLIAEIEAAGITTYKLALMMHRQFGWVERIRGGQEPKYFEGAMLLMIHGECVSEENVDCQRLNGPIVQDGERQQV